MRKNRVFIRILTVSLSCFMGICLLSGCNVSGQTGEANNKAGQKGAWYAEYSLETEKISIWAHYPPGPQGGSLEPIVEITDVDEIKSVVNAIDFTSWTMVEKKAQAAGIPYYFVDLNNGTAFDLYDTYAYGSIGKKIVSGQSDDNDISQYVDDALPGYYEMPDGLLKAVQDLVAKYAPEALPENSAN
ncbi:MAG: hypothetical protein ACOX05_03620 [Bacillota bacterium]|jgi:hypothetical protein